MYYIPLLQGRTQAGPGRRGNGSGCRLKNLSMPEHCSVTVSDALPQFSPEHCNITDPGLTSFLGPPLGQSLSSIV
jgi:hypothetical protein